MFRFHGRVKNSVGLAVRAAFFNGRGGQYNSPNTTGGFFESAYFYAVRTSTITQSRGAGTPTETRATVATVMGYAADAVLADGQTLLTVASGELRFQGARRVSEGVWSNVDADGAPIPAATLKGAVVEAAATQYLGVTGTPATQTTASLGTGTYTLWVEGTGSALASAGTATISGEAAATEGSHNTFTVSGAGTVTVTVTGSLTFFQLENSPYPTQRIDNAGAVGTSATRNKDVLDDQVASNLTAAAGTVAFTWTPSHDPSGTIALCGSYVDASNYTMVLAQKVTNLLSSPEDLTAAPWIMGAGSRTETTYTMSSATNNIYNPVAVPATLGKTFIVSFTLACASGTGTIAALTTNALAYNTGNGQSFVATTTPTRYSITCTMSGANNTTLNVVFGDVNYATGLTVGGTTGLAFTITNVLVTDVTNDVSKFAAPYTATTATFAIFREVIAAAAYDAYISHEYANGTAAKISLTWGASGINLAVDGTLGTAHANTDDAQLGTRWQWGADGNGGQQAGSAFKEMYLTPRTMSDAELQAITV